MNPAQSKVWLVGRQRLAIPASSSKVLIFSTRSARSSFREKSECFLSLRLHAAALSSLGTEDASAIKNPPYGNGAWELQPCSQLFEAFLIMLLHSRQLWTLNNDRRPLRNEYKRGVVVSCVRGSGKQMESPLDVYRVGTWSCLIHHRGHPRGLFCSVFLSMWAQIEGGALVWRHTTMAAHTAEVPFWGMWSWRTVPVTWR